jgi:hypothetical protein
VTGRGFVYIGYGSGEGDKTMSTTEKKILVFFFLIKNTETQKTAIIFASKIITVQSPKFGILVFFYA